jgi:hypothetical protein
VTLTPEQCLNDVINVMNTIGMMIDGDMEDDLMVIWNQLNYIIANWDNYLEVKQ